MYSTRVWILLFLAKKQLWLELKNKVIFWKWEVIVKVIEVIDYFTKVIDYKYNYFPKNQNVIDYKYNYF